MDKISIGKIIKKFRKQNKLTQEELSEKINISTNYLSKIERGLSILNTETFLKMADVLKFSLDDFGINNNKIIDKSKKELIEKIILLSDKEIKYIHKTIENIKQLR